MIWGLCESPITFNAIIEWSHALNEGNMQLREILDLDAMLSKGPTPEQVEGDESGEDGDISEKTAGPSYKEEEEVEDEPEAGAEDEKDSLFERSTPRKTDAKEVENTHPPAPLEEAQQPTAQNTYAPPNTLLQNLSRATTPPF